MTASVPPDPERLTLRAAPRVTRLNRRTLAILGAIVMSVMAVALFWAFRAPKQVGVSAIGVGNANQVPRAEGLNTLPRDYAGLPKAPVLGPPLGELGRSTLNAERAAGVAPSGANFRPDPEEETAQADALRERSEANEARKGTVFYQLRERAAATAGRTNSTPSAETGSVEDAALTNRGARERDPNQQDRKAAFVNAKADASIYGSGTLQIPRSPYELLAGTVIPAALWTAINSDLPGGIVAGVTENVYDTVTGRYLLIPQGSRLIGQYDSQVAFGQRRVLLVWTRLIRPDGSSIVLDRLPATDATGAAGVSDGTNYHWGRLFAAAAVSTLIGTSAELAIPQGRQGTSVIVAARESLQDSVNQVGQELTRRNLDVQPTLTIRAGFPVRALVRKDLLLLPYTPSRSSP